MGELPFGDAALQQLQHPHAGPQLQQQPSGSLEFLPKCSDVLNRVYQACGNMGTLWNIPVKDVFYKPVIETFPSIAASYYKAIAQPMTFRMIEEKIARHEYLHAQQFADVSAQCASGLTTP
jgi:hypothetical protein